MNRLLILAGFCLLLTSCGPDSQIVVVSVEDHFTGRSLDSVQVELISMIPGESSPKVLSTRHTGENGSVSFSYDRYQDQVYSIRSSRKYYEPLLNEGGDQYLNESILGAGDSVILRHQLSQIEAPDPDFLAKVREEVGLEEVLTRLKANHWNFALLPQFTWKDVPQLIDLGGDTTLITKYPLNPNSTYRPKHARVGLVALWLVEAIRKSEMVGISDELQNLVPPSRAPILGTSQGNPSGKNTADQILRAQAAYQAWYEAVEAAPRNRRINEMRNIPLRNEGMSWM